MFYEKNDFLTVLQISFNSIFTNLSNNWKKLKFLLRH